MTCRAWPLLVAIAITSGCRLPQPDGFDGARIRIADGDLVGALVLLDRVAPADPDYGEARSLASAVERRLRTSQRLFARGLALRAEWRDDEAVENFELARGVWPGLDGVDELIEATRLRARTLGAPSDPARAGDLSGAVAMTTPIDRAGSAPAPHSDGGDASFDADAALPAAPALETAIPGSRAEDAPPQGPQAGSVTERPARSDQASTEPASTEPASTDSAATDPATVVAIVRARLGQARAHLRGGRLDDALTLLHELRAQYPGRVEVAELRVRVLHQRALLHYGQGELSQAIEAWELLLASEPGHAQAREFRDAARSELGALRRR